GVVSTKPSGTGKPAHWSSPRFAPLPPATSTSAAPRSRIRLTNLSRRANSTFVDISPHTILLPPIRPALRRDQYQALAVAHEEERCLAPQPAACAGVVTSSSVWPGAEPKRPRVTVSRKRSTGGITRSSTRTTESRAVSRPRMEEGTAGLYGARPFES